MFKINHPYSIKLTSPATRRHCMILGSQGTELSILRPTQWGVNRHA